MFNIFHPLDPIGFRFEPLFFPGLDPVPPPVRLPNWRTNGAKEYWQWERDFSKAKNAIKSFWVDAGQQIRTMFGKKEIKGDQISSFQLSSFTTSLSFI